MSRAVAEPESVLRDYDVVFAKARSAIEAMAVGCAVVVADVAGVGGYVTPDNVEELRRLNFGVRTMQAERLSAPSIGAALDRYDPLASAEVSRWIRSHANFTDSVDAFEALYRDLRREGSPWSADASLEFSKAASHYLSTLSPILKGRHDAELRARAADADAAGMRAEMQRASDEIRNSKAWRLVGGYRRLRAKFGL